MTVLTTKNLSLAPSPIPLYLYADQYDKGNGNSGRYFILNIQLNGNNYYPQTGATVNVEGTKPNGETFNHIITNTLSMVYLPVLEDMTDIAGNVEMQIVVKEGNNRTASQLIILDVQRSAYNP